MKLLKSTVSVLLVLATCPALACQPLPQSNYAQTPQRVKERFDSVDSVELAMAHRRAAALPPAAAPRVSH